MDIEPAAVLAAHANPQQTPWCIVCNRDGDVAWPCLPYRLAEALMAETARVKQIAELVEPLVEINKELARLAGGLLSIAHSERAH